MKTLLLSILAFFVLISSFCFAQKNDDTHKGLPTWFNKNPLYPSKQSVEFSEWNNNGEHSFNIKGNPVVIYGKVISFTYYPNIHGDAILEFYRKKIKKLNGEILFSEKMMSIIGKYTFDNKEYWVEVTLTMWGKECNIVIVEKSDNIMRSLENTHIEQSNLSCNYSNTHPINFRSNTLSDVVTISVNGTSCTESKLLIDIISNTKEHLYKYETPLKNYFPEDPPFSYIKIKEVVDDLLKNIIIPVKTKLESFESDGVCYFVIPKKKYHQIIKNDQSVFSHNTHYEADIYFVYDHQSKQSRVVMECAP